MISDFSATTVKRIVNDTNTKVTDVISKLTLVAQDYNVPRVEEAIEALKDLLGHKDLRMTQVYASHLSQETVRQYI